jgi:hypothetical protein
MNGAPADRKQDSRAVHAGSDSPLTPSPARAVSPLFTRASKYTDDERDSMYGRMLFAEWRDIWREREVHKHR